MLMVQVWLRPGLHGGHGGGAAAVPAFGDGLHGVGAAGPARTDGSLRCGPHLGLDGPTGYFRFHDRGG